MNEDIEKLITERKLGQQINPEEKINVIKKLTKKYNVPADDYLTLENKICESGNAKDIFLFAYYAGEEANMQRLAVNILFTKNVKYIYAFAAVINLLSFVPLFEEEIIKRQNTKYIYKFARDVKGADIIKLGNKIIEKGNSNYILLFASDVIGESFLSKLNNALEKNHNKQLKKDVEIKEIYVPLGNLLDEDENIKQL